MIKKIRVYKVFFDIDKLDLGIKEEERYKTKRDAEEAIKLIKKVRKMGARKWLLSLGKFKDKDI